MNCNTLDCKIKEKLWEAMVIRRYEFMSAVAEGNEENIRKYQTLFGNTIDLLLYAEVISNEVYIRELNIIAEHGRK